MSCLKNFILVCFALLASTAHAAAPATASNTKKPSKATTHAHTSIPATPTNANAAKPKTKLKMAANDTVIYVGDLHCKHCAKKIASRLYSVKGVVKVRTDLKADVAIVSPQAKKQLDPLALWKAAKASGFPAVRLEGPSGTYVADAKTKAAVLMPKKNAKQAAATPKKG